MLEELKQQFILSDDAVKLRLEPILTKVIKHCVIDKGGQVHITNKHLSGKQQVMLTIAARAIASQLDDDILPYVTVGEIAKYTGLPENQVRARAKDCITDRLAEATEKGTYRAILHKVENFLDSITKQ